MPRVYIPRPTPKKPKQYRHCINGNGHPRPQPGYRFCERCHTFWAKLDQDIASMMEPDMFDNLIQGA